MNDQITLATSQRSVDSCVRDDVLYLFNKEQKLVINYIIKNVFGKNYYLQNTLTYYTRLKTE